MIRVLASLLCQALAGLTLGLLIATLAHAASPSPAPRAKWVRAL
ncbi:hypothetical protein [Pseudomonas eucalypticola]|nr:hypothetical protein [Pseudomonas eucalypticola]